MIPRNHQVCDQGVQYMTSRETPAIGQRAPSLPRTCLVSALTKTASCPRSMIPWLMEPLFLLIHYTITIFRDHP